MVISLAQALSDMEYQVQRLEHVINDIKADLSREQRNPRIIVKDWLEKAEKAIDTSVSMGYDYQQQKNCLGWCPNFFCRYRISKDIREWKLKVDELHQEKRTDFPPTGEYGDFTPPTQIPIQIPRPGFVGDAIEYAQWKLEEWLTADRDIRIIGVHGMGGVGKTSLLQNINNSNWVSRIFDLIIWVNKSTISQIYKIALPRD